ncbi:AAA family ATPase [Halopiger xanaduensis]|uniref:Kinase n=1 Tax=Halopiger xanaduensis (strain DSM 18323 / JCM 14033 / SH-6) TaxID=797210 RepID=F8D9Y7_HALXS|nr:AAA family ATPase [Halopiger xanaduensis]AEH35771.1 hypothetical protein Halxa_1137 [Halopiger xanaduensis SH-6]
MARPTLIVYCGLPGVGKSAASAYTASNLPAERYRSDEVRKQLFPDPEYTAEETQATYDELLERAWPDLEAGSNVVLDATFKTKRLRNRAATLADDVGAEAIFTRVTCDADVVETRIENRTSTDSVSDADLRVYRLVKESFEPLEREHVVIDNSGSIEETYRQIDRTLLHALCK